MRWSLVVAGSIAVGCVAHPLVSGCGPRAPYPPPATPPHPSEAPSIELSRLTLRGGSTMVVADDEVRREMRTSGRERIVAYVKICFEADGAVGSLRFYKPSGVAAYDRQVRREIRERWRIAPVLMDGDPVPACTHVAFDFHAP